MKHLSKFFFFFFAQPFLALTNFTIIVTLTHFDLLCNNIKSNKSNLGKSVLFHSGAHLLALYNQTSQLSVDDVVNIKMATITSQKSYWYQFEADLTEAQVSEKNYPTLTEI